MAAAGGGVGLILNDLGQPFSLKGGLYAKQIVGEQRMWVEGVERVGGAEAILEFANATSELRYLLMQVLCRREDEAGVCV